MPITQLNKLGPYRNPDGRLILLGLPDGFPPFMAAVMYLGDAIKKNKETIRLEYGGGGAKVVEYRVDHVYKEARKRGLLRSTHAVTPTDDKDILIDRFQCYPGVAFASKEKDNG
jgi:hypothetical protein